MGIGLISRSDDFGSSRAANRAILDAVRCGIVTRNVSCMAPAPFIAEAAGELAKYCHIDIGMHATLNAEWNGIRWGALTTDAYKNGLTYEDGTFFRSQKELAAHHPDVEAILREFDAQLDRLTKLGLPVTYADSHMFPEYFIPGLYEAYDEWIRRKGLLSAEDYYTLNDPMCPPTRESEAEYLGGVEKWLAGLEAGKQFFYLTHPAADSEESLLMMNDTIPAGAMRLERRMEHLAVTTPRWKDWMERWQLTPLRYRDARKVPRGAFQNFF